jgi:hypothetical protein
MWKKYEFIFGKKYSSNFYCFQKDLNLSGLKYMDIKYIGCPGIGMIIA